MNLTYKSVDIGNVGHCNVLHRRAKKFKRNRIIPFLSFKDNDYELQSACFHMIHSYQSLLYP